jgi:hypothetical protein
MEENEVSKLVLSVYYQSLEKLLINLIDFSIKINAKYSF